MIYEMDEGLHLFSGRGGWALGVMLFPWNEEFVCYTHHSDGTLLPEDGKHPYLFSAATLTIIATCYCEEIAYLAYLEEDDLIYIPNLRKSLLRLQTKAKRLSR